MPSPEQHLFLSYAHRDDVPLVAGQAGWVERFQEALKVRLGQLLGREPKVWWDRREIQGNEIFSGVIEDGLVRSAVLVPLVTPSYQASEWCQRELDNFCAAAEKAGGWRLGNRTRIFKVIKTPVPYGEQPEELQGLIGYEFFRKDPATGRIHELQILDPERPDPDYLQKVDDLAQDIRALVEDLLEPAAATAADAPAVYLAEGTSDVGPEREQLLRSLKQLGFAVYPQHPLGTLGAEMRRQAGEALAAARLSVHLIGANYGAVPENETESAAEIQAALAAARGEADPAFRRLIWLRPGAEPKDPRQSALVAKLRDIPAGQRGVEILAGSLEALQGQIETILRPPPAPAKAPAGAAGAAGEGELRYVYLLHDARDRAAAEALRDALYTASPRVEVVLPVIEGDAAELRAIHTENLLTCDALLFYWGEAGEAWLRSRLLDLRKAAGLGRQTPFLAAAVWVAGTGPGKDGWRSREALVLRPFPDGEAAALAPFLAELLAAPGAGP